jgi:hypothetical protein
MSACEDCRKQNRCAWPNTPNCDYFVPKIALKNDKATEKGEQ